MNTHSLTFPTLVPGLTSRPANARPRGRGSRLPAVLKDLQARLPARDLASQADKRLLRSARRGQRIVLGTLETPYEPLLLNGAPLTALRQFSDLEIVITTRSPEIREELALLVELDVRHAVTVDMVIATGDPSSPDLQEQLFAVAALAAEGLTTRLVMAGLPEVENGRRHRVAADLRRLFESAHQSRAFDVTLFDGEAAETPTGWNPLIQRLRLEYGFPCRLPGRG